MSNPKSSKSRHGKSSSIDISQSGTAPNLTQKVKAAIRKMSGVNEGEDEFEDTPLQGKGQTMVWKEREGDVALSEFWGASKVLMALAGTVVLACGACYVLYSSTLRKAPAPSSSCNPWAGPGELHIDYSNPANNYFIPSSQSEGYFSSPTTSCPVPRYMSQLLSGDISSLSFMQNKTVVLIGDSIERDHVSLFCSTLGSDFTTVKGKHPLALPESKGKAATKKDRASRMAWKGMQDSTLPRICHIKELNFAIINFYHFGMDEEEYWKDLAQFHHPGSIEGRFSSLILPTLAKLPLLGLSPSPSLVEISSGMYDLARWAQQDISKKASTTSKVDAHRLSWWQHRMKMFVDLTIHHFPEARKTWRGITTPEDQASEMDYFNDSFGHAPKDVIPHFALSRVQQLDTMARRLLRKYAHSRHTKKSNEVHYNNWSSLLKGASPHLYDRLHGSDDATPGAVLWSDIMLWNLRESVEEGGSQSEEQL